VTSRDEGAVKALLSEGADVNVRNNSGQTPLILAIVSGQDHLLTLLLEAGADPSLRDHTQLNAVDWAERKGRGDLTQLLARTTQSSNSSTRNLNEKLLKRKRRLLHPSTRSAMVGLYLPMKNLASGSQA